MVRGTVQPGERKTMMSLGHRTIAVCLLLSLTLGFTTAQNDTNTMDAILEVDLRILGNSVLPFTQQYQNAVISGVSNVLGDGVLASDISLTVLQTYTSITAYGSRRLLQSSYPGVDVALNITTSSSKVQNESATLLAASNQTYQLATSIGQQGLQTQQIAIQSSSIQYLGSSSPTTSASSPPSTSLSPPPPSTSTPTPTSTSTSPSASSSQPASAHTNTGSASGSSASSTSSTKSGSSFPAGAIVGIVAGVAILIAVAAALVVWRRKKSQKFAEQTDVIDYYHSGAGKQGGVAGGPMIADSAFRASAAPTLPVTDKELFGVGKIDDKTEYADGGEKAEVPRPSNGPTHFMDVQL